MLWSARAFRDFSWQRSILERRLVSELAWQRIVLAKQRQKLHRTVVCSSVGYLVGMIRRGGIITRLEFAGEEWCLMGQLENHKAG